MSTQKQREAAIAKEFFDSLGGRDEWDAQYRDGFGSRLHAYPLSMVVLHHSVTKHLAAAVTAASEHVQMRVLERIGQNRFGGGISYTCPVFPSGRAYQGTGFSRLGAHTGGYNTIAFAFCLVGNFETNKVTEAQVDRIARGLIALYYEGIIAVRRITHCHHDVFGTSCPGRYGCVAKSSRIPRRVNQLLTGSATTKPAGTPAANPPKNTGQETPGSTVGPFSGWVRATEDGPLTVSPHSTSKKVLDIKADQVLYAGDGEAPWHTEIGEGYWFPNRRVEPSSGVKADGLLPGQWPYRQMPVTTHRTTELGFAWRELLSQVLGRKVGNLYKDRHEWLGERGYSGTHNQRLQKFLADSEVRTAPDGLPFYRNAAGSGRGVIDGHLGDRSTQAEFRYLNWQAEFVDAVHYFSHY